MSVTAYQRGHLIQYTDYGWVYADNHMPISVERPCIRCGKLPNEDGSDACLGHIDSVKSACCGHGVENPYQLKEEEQNEYGI